MLLKGGRVPLKETLPRGDYFYLVSRGDRRPNCEIFHSNTDDFLPTVPVPLKAPDGDIFCDLSKVFAIAYERGRYRKAIDY